MKAILNPTKHFLWTALEVKVSEDRKINSITFLEDVSEIRLEDTRGRVRHYFEQDLIDGPDRFLVYVFEKGSDYYKFDIIIKTDDIAEFFYHAGSLSKTVVRDDLKNQTVATLI